MVLESGSSQSKRVYIIRLIFGALLLILCVRWCVEGSPLLSTAQAQLPNPASQRLELVQEMRRTNELLEDIRQLLKSGTLHVRVEGADNQADAPAGSARSTP